MYRHKKVYEIKYTDADAYDNLKLSSLLSYMEESACLSADELGFGYDDIAPLNIGFMVVNWYTEFTRPIKLGDKLEIHTWPLKVNKIIILRDFEFFIGGEKVGVGTARWCMFDTVTFSVLPTGAFFKEGACDGYNTERSIDFKNWKIPHIGDSGCVYSKVIKYSDYDHYFHVNNTKYADFSMDVFSVEELKGKYVKSMQITYVKQCKYGEKLDFYRNDCGSYTIIEGRVGDEIRVQMKVEFDVL